MDSKVSYSAEFEGKMQAARVSATAIRAFRHNYQRLVEGDSGMIAESEIQSVQELPRWEQLEGAAADSASLLERAVVLKLNGGLGTGMGLERAKSLLVVKEKLTFLDFIVRQVLHLQKEFQRPVSFAVMNSFSTSRDTVEFLGRFPDVGRPEQLELLQSQAPKVDAQSLKPITWPDNPQLEWCPPGHGDIYPSLLSSGLLERWLKQGKQYLFVSNSDNLGATLDLSILSYFARSEMAFLMEVAERTASDSKGGHLARRGARLLLRESAQCPKADQAAFQDIRKHRFFNTNNLWLRLDALQSILDEYHGFIPLPLIKNEKTVDPRDSSSPKVYQLETAMGAAIQCFDSAGALVVPRSRFAPVKTTSDLLALRSDAYRITLDWRIVLDRDGQAPPTIELDPKSYKLVDQLEEAIRAGAPSLKHCDSLAVRGPVRFHPENVFRGKVVIENQSPERRELPPGQYADCSKSLA